MTTLLAIDFSPRGPLSVSKTLTDRFVSAWTERHPDAAVIHRDVGANPPPHLDGETIGAFFVPPEDRDGAQRDKVALSDTLVDEFEAADLVVLGVPMFNFGSPSGFKAWVDHVVRPGRTFRYTESGIEGMMGGRRVVVLTARGGDYAEGAPFAAFDQQAPYIRTVFGALGIGDVTFVHAHKQDMGPEPAAEGRAAAEAAVDALVGDLSRNAAA